MFSNIIYIMQNKSVQSKVSEIMTKKLKNPDLRFKKLPNKLKNYSVTTYVPGHSKKLGVTVTLDKWLNSDISKLRKDAENKINKK